MTTHFWVCAYPFLDSSIFVVPPVLSVPLEPDSFSSVPAETEVGSAVTAAVNNTEIKRPKNSTAQTMVTLFDADGDVANELTLSYPINEIGILELETLMGACKLESGLKHAHVMVESERGYAHYCRLHTREGAAILGVPSQLSVAHSTFFPLTFDEGRSYFVSLINHSRTPAAVKCRLFSAKRSPETLISVPALGARVLQVETEFPDYAGNNEGGKQLQAYLRLSTKSEATLGAQLIERHATKADSGVFYAVG